VATSGEAMGGGRSGERYDRRYFDHWYRHEGFGDPAHLQRKLSYAVGAAEYLLERPVASVLDVGCGEGPWQPALRRLRPAARYLGIDPSSYAIDRFGTRRHLRLGGLGALADDEFVSSLGGPFDLVVCVDVLAYAPSDEVRAGLRAIAGLVSGVALIEVFTSADHFEGDLSGHTRNPSVYRRWFAQAGLQHIGPNLFTTTALRSELPTFQGGP
jgi:SAM-dependent methyltransferase